ncbi:hypothetical protein DENIS_3425 [Desulfonema ishimotonii]|uniref:Uncharacterized protein n=1 Tax=Desulfonema ishimotonii TaxID=45657 RepID=A0A401FZU0_9BACT|nr:hypothetical protein [Desulfonema ishimotonii]GBC62453.1 hypothetical protein DENIS_3425 [Desulfonema ishimotonii]
MEDKAKQKKMAAAIAGVSAYIKSQEEMAAMYVAAPVEEAPARPVALPSMWAVSGRVDQMQMRNMMQMKAFHGVKFR